MADKKCQVADKNCQVADKNFQVADKKNGRWQTKAVRWQTKTARWQTKNVRWQKESSRWQTKIARWQTKTARWQTKKCQVANKRCQAAAKSRLLGMVGGSLTVSRLLFVFLTFAFPKRQVYCCFGFFPNSFSLRVLVGLNRDPRGCPPSACGFCRVDWRCPLFDDSCTLLIHFGPSMPARCPSWDPDT